MIPEVAWLCFIFPFAGALLSPVLAKIHPKLRDYGEVFLSFLAAVCSLTLIPYLFNLSKLPIESKVVWLTSPIELKVGILLDPLSIVMANVVAVISFFIMLYSIGYMKGSPYLTRWWMWMNLFIGSMLLLVLTNNLLFLFIGWKLVGLCSWGLISFYYKDEKEYCVGGPPPTKYVTPSHAGLKALIVTSAGDVVMLGGMLIIYAYAGTLNILELYETVTTWMPEMSMRTGMILMVSIFILAGAFGKSAQFPFHEWLPEAMTGPAPVSALIHAATMVKSGVYLIARFIPIFYYGYWIAGCYEAYYFFIITAWIGVLTAFIAASQGMVSLELKKVLAFSTVSQIGYMMLALGVAGLTPIILKYGFTGGIFHLMSHALFKACLFLCAGSVIHAAHSIYIHEMGSLRKYMKYTFVFMFIAALSLMGAPPLPGFWSKDLVLLSTLQVNNYPLFIIALFTAGITAFYSLRFIGMVFYGKESEHIEKLKQKGAHIHEAHPAMVFACGALIIPIVVFGIFGLKLEHFLKDIFGYSLKWLLSTRTHETISDHLLVPFLSVLAVGIGFITSYKFYISHKADPASILEKRTFLKSLHKFFWNRWYIDEYVYYKFFVGIINKLYASTPKYIEEPLNKVFHGMIPAIPDRIYNIVKNMRTEKRDTTLNLLYIIALFLIILVAMLLMEGRG